MAAFLTGIRSLVRFIKAFPNTGQFFRDNIGVVDTVVFPEVRFIAMASMVACASDAALSRMFTDSRFARICEKVAEAVKEDLVWLESIPLSIWHSTDAALEKEHDMSAVRLRADVLAGADISAWFLHIARQVAFASLTSRADLQGGADRSLPGHAATLRSCACFDAPIAVSC